jgi:5-hydroxyisourate hydrolase-like protein (transthyretin family)
MKFLNLIIAFIFIAGFITAASAQVCGSFGVTLNVYDNDLKPVADHSVKIVPWLKDELRGKTFEPVKDTPGASEITLLEGHIVTGNYRVIVSAPGFLPTEKTITFPHCTRLLYDILLLRKKEKNAVVTGHITDEEGRPVNYIWVTFVSYANGSTRSVSTDYMGNYELKLKPGDYKITFHTNSYLPLKTQKFTVPADGKAVFNLLLRSKQSYSLKEAGSMLPAAIGK